MGFKTGTTMLIMHLHKKYIVDKFKEHEGEEVYRHLGHAFVYSFSRSVLADGSWLRSQHTVQGKQSDRLWCKAKIEHTIP